MLTRRDIWAAGGAGLCALTIPAATGRLAARSARWVAVPDGTRTEVNGFQFEAECGRGPVAVQRSADNVVRFSMVPGNGWHEDDPVAVERAELDGWKQQIPASTRFWASWSMVYEPGLWSTSEWCILRQIYGRTATGGAPWSVLVLKPGGVLHWVGGAASDPKGFWPLRHQHKIEQGTWVHVVESFHLDQTAGGGYWRVWVNGQQILDLNGLYGHKDARSYFFKFGIYRSRQQKSGAPVTERIAMRFSDVRFGVQDQSALITSPPQGLALDGPLE